MTTSRPPLPNLLSVKAPNEYHSFGGPKPVKIIRHGCWLINYQPSSLTPVAYDGTLRVESKTVGQIISGDLYERPVIVTPGGPPSSPISLSLQPPPSPQNGIPIQGRQHYSYYLRVTKIDYDVPGTTFSLGMEMYYYDDKHKKPDFTFTKDAHDYTAKLTWMAALPGSGYPSTKDYAEGDIRSDVTGAVVGRLTMGWISEFYRKCSLQIDAVLGSELPLDDGAGHDWQTVFKGIGFELDMKPSHYNVKDPHTSGGAWRLDELHKSMREYRHSDNLDTEWLFYLFAVNRVKDNGGGDDYFGYMFDYGTVDTDNTPREGSAVCSDIKFPNDPKWGTASGLHLGKVKSAYFRTAVHELGHAFGLEHIEPFMDSSFMNQTGCIAQPGNNFPNNFKWSFADENLLELRHWPDMFVRPGGVEFESATDDSPPVSRGTEILMKGLELEVKPSLGQVILEDPVTVNIKLTNTSDQSLQVPSNLSFAAGYVSGSITDASGKVRRFKRPNGCDRLQTLKDLDPGKSISASLTRGSSSLPVFPTIGVAKIVINVRWYIRPGALGYVTGNTTVEILARPPAAPETLTTPETHPVLTSRGDHLAPGIEKTHQVLEDKTLCPHFACIETGRRSQQLLDRSVDVGSASGLLDEEVVMSHAEGAKLGGMNLSDEWTVVGAEEVASNTGQDPSHSQSSCQIM